MSEKLLIGTVSNNQTKLYNGATTSTGKTNTKRHMEGPCGATIKYRSLSQAPRPPVDTVREKS